MNVKLIFYTVLVFCFLFVTPFVQCNTKTPIKAIYIPLADHYAGIVAYEKYRDRMTTADYTIERMKTWSILRAYFESGVYCHRH